jgi:hypothetical protein
MKTSLKILAAAAVVAATAIAAVPASASGYPIGLYGLGLVGPYGYYQDAYVDAYYGPAWTWGHRRYGYRDPYYHRSPIYGTSYAAPSYVDEDCRIQEQPTAYGWRRYRVCH